MFDPLTQRTTGPAAQAVLTPAVEYPLDPDKRDAAAAALDAHAWTDPEFAPEFSPDDIALPNQRLVPLTDYVPGAAWWADAEVADRWAAAAKAIQDAYAAASAARRAAPDAPPPPRPSRLYVTPAKLTAALSSPVLVPDGEAHGDAVPAPARHRRPDPRRPVRPGPGPRRRHGHPRRPRARRRQPGPPWFRRPRRRRAADGGRRGPGHAGPADAAARRPASRATATRLAAAAARAQASAPVMVPPAAPYAVLARRFPYPLTRDQRDATDAVLADLASGRPMDRLLCGDVGFGKTEVALRAAAAAAVALTG